jgi:hypothetical protein
MALPPAWIAVFNAARKVGIAMTKAEAAQLVEQLEDGAVSVVPSWAVDHDKLRTTNLIDLSWEPR